MSDVAKDNLLSNAGSLLMAAGFIAAFTGGMYGLQHNDPGLVVLAVLLLIGYGVVGHLLRSMGAAYFAFVLPASGVLVLMTLFVLRGDVGDVLDLGVGGDYFLYPVLALVLSFAGGALLTHAIERGRARVAWPNKGAARLPEARSAEDSRASPNRSSGVPSLNPLLHVAAYAPVWNAFTLLGMLGAQGSALRIVVVGASVCASIACVVAGYAAARHGHPALTVAGAALGFLTSVFYLFQFMLGGGNRGGAFFGEFNALLGLILTGLPIAIGTVAWVQLLAAPRAGEEALPYPPDGGNAFR
jgi:hypothetical protein